MTTRLIEKWLPIAALGEESVRERRSMTALPPTYYLHVWWARRPLVASRAAILASLLPEDADRDKFLHMLGIHGDPVETRRRIEAAKRTGEDLGTNPYGYKRAFTYVPQAEEIAWFKAEVHGLGLEEPNMLDPTAGGGSIPFEATRLGVEAMANELNPVAALILRQTVEAPLKHGSRVLQEYNRISNKFLKRAEPRYEHVFPPEPNNNIVDGYLWIRTITCPYCEGLIPLSPNWRLAPDGTGVRLHPDPNTRVCSFEIVHRASEQSEGTSSGGDARCPFLECSRVVNGDEVKRQAQAGQMGEQLFTIVYKERVESKTKSGKLRQKWNRSYRAPLPTDDNSEEISARLAEKLREWEVLDMVPTEAIPVGLKTAEPLNHGMLLWRDLFSPRQLLCHGTGVEVFRELLIEEEAKGQLAEETKAAFVYLSFALDKLLNWNSILSSWNINAQRLRSTFDEHNYSIKMSFGEMAPFGTGQGYKWALAQIGKCIRELISLVRADINEAKGNPSEQQALALDDSFNPPRVAVTYKSADSLDHLDDASVDLVVIDPPYYGNVMYAELSDFFYVWLKRTAGYVYPELFGRQLTDKDSEAVANPTRFKGQKGAAALAGRDYKQRMTSILAECRRVLKPDGIMTLMFTHKATGAWDSLTTGLIEGGFTITASWPINTEPEGSLHIKDKSAANSTIFLVCRPRAAKASDQVEYWEDVLPLVTKAVRERVEEYQASGITGVDLYLACFGPALQVFAEHWPLKRGQPRPQSPKPRRRATLSDEKEDPYAVIPEDALEAARSAVKEWRLQQIIHTTRRADLELLTEWFVLAWDTFRAPEFPYDEALRLARVVGLDLDSDVIGRLAEKKASNVVLWDSAKRAAKGALGPPDGSRGMIDALHHAAHMVRTQGLNAGRDLLERSGAENQSGFATALTALLEVLPVSSTFTHVTGETGAVADAASDFDALENLRRLAFTDRVPEPQQLRLWMEPVA
jgi:adenine-specific DNA methylase